MFFQWNILLVAVFLYYNYLPELEIDATFYLRRILDMYIAIHSKFMRDFSSFDVMIMPANFSTKIIT